MKREDLGIWLGIPSRGRPGNVAAMQALVGPATWYVRPEEAEAYRDAGAAEVATGGNLIPRRNQILEDGFRLNLPSVQISDDIQKIELATGDPLKKVGLSFDAMITLIELRARQAGVKLVGTNSTTNLFYCNPKKLVKRNVFCPSTFLYVLPSTPRMDPEMSLKEDYDFNLQHLVQHDGWLRCDDILIESPHHGNKGGCNLYRDPAEEQRNIAILKKKWGDLIRDNPNRPNEVLLKRISG